MLFKDASESARLLKIGESVAAYRIPSNLPIFRGAYIIDPGYMSIVLNESNVSEKICVVPSGLIMMMSFLRHLKQLMIIIYL